MSLHVTADCLKHSYYRKVCGWMDRAVILVPWKCWSLEIFWANLIHNSDKIQQSSSTIEKERKVLRIKIVSLYTDRRLRWSNIEQLTLSIYSMVGCFKSPKSLLQVTAVGIMNRQSLSKDEKTLGLSDQRQEHIGVYFREANTAKIALNIYLIPLPETFPQSMCCHIITFRFYVNHVANSF